MSILINPSAYTHKEVSLTSPSSVAQKLSYFLARTGPSRASALLGHTGASQATLSRAIALLGRDVVRSGRGTRTNYALRRRIEGVGDEIALFEILPTGEAVTRGHLVPLAPGGFWYFTADVKREAEFSRDLPWFMADLRPSGFLGALIPVRHPDLDAPADVRLWTADHCLRFLTKYGADNLGSLVFGERALRLALARRGHHPQGKGEVLEGNKSERYAEISEDVVRHGDLGSAAAGEQPKFLVTLSPSQVPVLVKFSPPTSSDFGRRWADILVCEHIALETLRDHGRQAAKSKLIAHREHVFLEVERFDRIAPNGRRGVVSLAALDDAHSGILGDWISTTQALRDEGVISEESVIEARWRQRFGEFTANDDMHRHNLSFFQENLTPAELTPTYDAAPMFFRPRLGVTSLASPKTFHPPIELPADTPVWKSVQDVARDYWNRVAQDHRISSDFQWMAKACLEVISANT